MERPDLRDELLALEPMNPVLRQEYERRVREMMERQLTKGQRIAWGLSTAMSLAFFIGFGYMALIASAGLPWQARVGFGAGSLFGLGFALLGIDVLRRGRVRLRFDNSASAGLAWGVVLVNFIVTMQLAPEVRDPYRGTLMVLMSLGFLVMGLGFLLGNIVVQNALGIREDILRVQIEMAELKEKMGAS